MDQSDRNDYILYIYDYIIDLIDMNIYTRNLPACKSGQYIYVTGLFNFFFVLHDLIGRINSYFQRTAF